MSIPSFKPKAPSTNKSKRELTNPNLTAIFDLDAIKFAASSVGEKRTIKVKHIKSGKIKEFDNRTELWGRSKKTIGGWLGETNTKREEKGLKPFTKDDFEIEDVQEGEALENLLHTAKMMVEGVLDQLGTNKAEYYLGEGSSFRLGLSTLMEYKGNRKDLIKPVHLEAVSDYLKEKYSTKIIKGIECDDAVVMRAYQDDNAVICGVDKDFRGCPVKFFDTNNPDEGIINGDCFGELVDKGNKISGYGRVFFYYQMLAGDSSDHYKASCFSKKNLGDKGVYNKLKDCSDDKEALIVTIETFKELYPEPVEVQGWRGNYFTIDWLYAMKEQFVMARMLRFDNDLLSLEDWCSEYGVQL